MSLELRASLRHYIASLQRPWKSRATALRFGFAIVVGLLILSAVQAYRIQQIQSRQTMEIYRRHLDQDVVLYQLRRTIWIAAVNARDYLIDPASADRLRYLARLSELKADADKQQRQFDLLAAGHESSRQFRRHLQRFWETLEKLPFTAQEQLPAQRYQFVQDQILPRRNAAGNALREFTEMTQEALRSNETAFEESHKQAVRSLQILLSITALIGILVAWISLSHSESLERFTREQHREAERAREELQLLTGRLMSIQEEERSKLSREMHDEIGQALATIRLEIVRTETVCLQRLPEVLDRLARAREIAERTVAVVRNMSALLRPSVLDDLGLMPALRALAEEFTARTGVPCTVAIPEKAPALSADVTTCVYRVVQESLHNCEKHASASRVCMSAYQTESLFIAEVNDDGSGFDPTHPDRATGVRLGIAGMRERAVNVGGTLETESSPGQGTQIRLTVPRSTRFAEMTVNQTQGACV
jgi:signal transduction histidine kinase